MGSELRIPNAAAQTRIVSGGPFGRAKESLSRHLKYMAGARIPEFESSQSVSNASHMKVAARYREVSQI